MKNRTDLYTLSRKHFYDKKPNIALALSYSLQCLEDGTLWFRTIVTWWQESFKSIAQKSNEQITNFIEYHHVPLDLMIDKKGNTMLHYFAKDQNTHICRYLSGRGAKQQHNAQGDTPIMLGCDGVKNALSAKGTVNGAIVTWVSKCERKTGNKFDDNIFKIINEFCGGAQALGR